MALLSDNTNSKYDSDIEVIGQREVYHAYKQALCSLSNLHFIHHFNSMTTSSVNMNEQLQSNCSIEDKNTVQLPTTSSTNTSGQQRVTQNFILIWLDTNIDPTSENCQNSITHLK